MPRKLKVVALREDYAALTGDYKQAIILNELVYRQSRAQDVDEYLNELRADASAFLTRGWFRRSAAEVARDTLLNLSPSNTLNHLRRLVASGWVDERPDPSDPTGKAKQYRVNLLKLNADLEAKGYRLEGWVLSESEKAFSESKKGSHETEKGRSESKKHYTNSKRTDFKDGLCERCSGSGFWYPQGFDKGVAKCPCREGK